MKRRVRFLIISGLVVGLVAILLVWRTAKEDEFTLPLSPVPPPTYPASSSPLTRPTVSPLHSPLAVPPMVPHPINTATLEAIRATRPTAIPPSPPGFRLPYISPTTWRDWALRMLAAAGVLAYVGLRLRRNQKM